MSVVQPQGPRRAAALRPFDSSPVLAPSNPAQSATARRAPRASSLERRLMQRVGQAVVEHGLIADGDRIMVCVSGGKDSYALLDLLLLLQHRAPIRFEILAINVDQGWPGYRTDLIAAHLAARGVSHKMVQGDFASVVEANVPAGKTPCSL